MGAGHFALSCRAHVSALALAIVLLAGAARAVPITVGGAGGPAFQVDPIYYVAFDQFGLSGAGAGPDYLASAPVTWLSAGAGAGMQLTVSIALHTPVYQHPQNPADSQNPATNGGVATSPTAALPFVADSTWTVRNRAGRALEDVLLAFTKVSAATGYPAVDVALDDFVFDVLRYQGTTQVYLYGALPLGDLAAGEETQITVRYIVADPLLLVPTSYVMPPFALAALEGISYVPEPGTLLLFALGVAGLALRGGGRGCA